jgi:hypothetical protein
LLGGGPPRQSFAAVLCVVTVGELGDFELGRCVSILGLLFEQRPSPR